MYYVPWLTKTDCGMVSRVAVEIVNQRTKERYGWCLWGSRRRSRGNRDICCNGRIRIQLIPADMRQELAEIRNRKRCYNLPEIVKGRIRRYARWGRRSCKYSLSCPYDRQFQCHCVYCTLISPARSLALSRSLACSLARSLSRSVSFTHTHTAGTHTVLTQSTCLQKHPWQRMPFRTHEPRSR